MEDIVELENHKLQSNKAHALSMCVPKATNTNSQFVKFIAFLLQQWLHESASTLRYTYIACLVEYTISCAHHTDRRFHVNVQYTKTEVHCIVGKPEGELHRSKCVVLRTIYCYFYNR